MNKVSVLLATLLVSACTRAGGPLTTAPAAVNTVDIPRADNRAADTLLVEVSTLDPTILIDMRYATTNNFTGAKLPGYEANRAYMRREAARALVSVQGRVASRGLRLKIYDAYRPVRATEEMVRWTERVRRPDLIADGYIASRSRHNLGMAVDLTLVDAKSGVELDMGTPFDTFSAAAHSANATGAVARNRTILKEAMTAAGFSPYSEEWWHFSFNVDNPVRFDRVIR